MHNLIIVILFTLLRINSSKSHDVTDEIHLDIIQFDDPDDFPEASSWFEKGDHFEGDIELSNRQKKRLFDFDAADKRTGLLFEEYRWPKDSEGTVNVPYEFSEDFDDKDRRFIKTVMSRFASLTCVKFIEHTNETDYIKFVSEGGCFSKLGRNGGEQKVSIKRFGCFKGGIIAHELIHSLGYTHMHTHVDRDDFVKINWENINPKHQRNFRRIDKKRFSNFNTTYDFGSLMHYEGYAFSLNKEATIEPIDEKFKGKFGQRKGFSEGDIKRIKNMYECS